MPPAKPKVREDFKTDKAWWEYKKKLRDDILATINSTSAFEKAIQKMYVSPIKDPLTAPEEEIQTLKTNTLLDKILSSEYGGLEPGSTCELYGEYATSKTQICLAFVAEALGLIVYIDAEDTFRRKRIRQIAEARGKSEEYIDDLEDRLLLYTPGDWMEQYWISKNLPEYAPDDSFLKVGLVIVDSAMKLFADSEDFFGREHMTRRQQLVRAHLLRLKNYAKRHGGVMVFTNQVYDKPTGIPKNFPLEMRIQGRGGKSIEHIPDYRILLIKKRGAVRVARLVDSIDQPLQEVPFMLGPKGIQDMPNKGELAKALEAAKKYKAKFEDGQVSSQKAAGHYEDDYLELAKDLGLLDEETKPSEEVAEEQVAIKIEEVEEPVVEENRPVPTET